MNYVAPAYRKKGFNCPFCSAYAQFFWRDLYESGPNGMNDCSVRLATCMHCKKNMVWHHFEGEPTMCWPARVSTAAPPHDDMPDDVRSIYEEARAIASDSARGAAALLRLAIQKLCKHFGLQGHNINDDIGTLVQQGLPVLIQQALDVVRVTGNNAVHPGQMQLDDSPQIVGSLFGLVNLIVDNRISEPRRIEELFQSLPEGSRSAIQRRDQ